MPLKEQHEQGPRPTSQSSLPSSSPARSSSDAALAPSANPYPPAANPGAPVFDAAHPTDTYVGDPPASRNLGQPAGQAVGERGLDINRYGLTSPAVAKDHLVAAKRPQGSPLSRASPSSPPDRPSTLLQGKRSSDEDEVGANITSSPAKKARTRFAPPPGGLDPGAFAKQQDHLIGRRDGPPSPLFFSHAAAKLMASRPPSVSFSASSEAAVAMMNRLREEAETVTTVQLPRAVVNAASPARSGSTPGSFSSSDPTSKGSDGRTPGFQLLQGIGVVELLEQDDRPTFVVDLGSPSMATRPGLQIVYANASLRTSPGIQELLSITTDDPVENPEFAQFKSWVVNAPSPGLRTASYAGITWSCSTIRKRLRFVTGTGIVRSTAPVPPGLTAAEEPSAVEQDREDPTPSQAHGTPMHLEIEEPDYFGHIQPPTPGEALSPPPDDTEMDIDLIERRGSDDFTLLGKDSFDWTTVPLSPDLPEHILLARSVDWASTPLGPIEDWPQELRVLSNMIMGSPNPSAMYWGPDMITLYNAAYVEIAGSKHPKLMGMRYKDGWQEIWDDLKPILRDAWESGQSIMKQDNRLFINRHGFLEEAFFSWSIIPLVGGDGSVVGLYNPAWENTRRKITDRRMHTLREVGQATAVAKDVRGFWPQVQKGLEYNEFDVPFALIYSVKDDSAESEVSSVQSGSPSHPPQIRLEGSLGVPVGHPAAVDNLDLRIADDGFAPYMRQSMIAPGLVVLTQEAGTLPVDLLEGLEWRGFGDPCDTVVIFPVHPTGIGDTVVGFIVLGVNPRRPYDEDYQLFIHLLARQLETSMASVVLFEEEIKRGQRAARLASLNQQELSLKLYLKTQEAVESEYRFTRMAEFAPVGMFIADNRGRISYCNDMWWQISRHVRSEATLDAWMDSVRDEDRPNLEAAWERLIQHKVPLTLEFRFKGQQQSDDHMVDTWVIMSAFPERDETGDLKGVFGCITDISAQKWAEDVQNRRREEAVELKRQQENFIDITSHEMRNPLSAVLQLADEITNGIAQFRENNSPSDEIDVLLDNCVDAANTINLCASHQKRIVDDILTLSKLDSHLLLVTPVDAQPVIIVHRVLKMFEAELKSHEIQLDFQLEPEYLTYNINWVKLDPSRLQQVLINLMTNAIKFTQNREKRHITVSLGASKHVAEATSRGISYWPPRKEEQDDLTDHEEWGHGEKINLHLAVRDTGPGLGKDEAKLLFQRFSQTSPRTHVQYGGSGLGLFICRILTELQGGWIGVTSQENVGSTFNFFIKARRSEITPADVDTVSPVNVAMSVNKAMEKPMGIGVATFRKESLQRRTSMRKQADGDGQAFDVLIVEDNLVNQRVLQKQLRNCGNNTYVANHGGEALDTLRRSRFWTGPKEQGEEGAVEVVKESDLVDISIILMDLEMPVMDGMTCARRIRELEKDGIIIGHIPIIAVTAYARPEQIENAKAAGIDDVISKPFRIPELIPKMEELVAKYNSLSPSSSQRSLAA